jgi:hypothetical protein
MDQALEVFPDDALPPEAVFSSQAELSEAINEWASMRGYAFVARRSSKAKTLSQALTVTYICDRGGGLRSDQASKRKTSSRRTGCPFSINAIESNCKTQWAVKHRKDPHTHMHNHEPSYGARAHPVHRRLKVDQEQTIRLLTEAGVRPKEIRTYIRLTDKFSLATQQDIYNAIARGKRSLANGQSSIHALAEELVDQGFGSHFCLDQDSRVTAVFFTNPESLTYTKSYPEVMMLDCTYKTNKYRMPLLDIVGIDACGKSFCIAFAFMSGEEEADYLWVLSRLREVYEAHGIALPSVILTDRCLACMNAIANAAAFPEPTRLLCIWHINQAVLAHCQPRFTKGIDDPEGHSKWLDFQKSFNYIVASETPAVYEERLAKFKVTYTPSHRDEVGYIMTTWLNPYKEKFVKAWVRNIPHFGQTTTSPAEGIHNLIKRHLTNNRADLFECWRHIKRAVDNQLQTLHDNIAQNNITEPTRQSIRLSRPLFGTVSGWVSHEAMLMVEKQVERLKSSIPTCTGTFTRSFGLPCAHTLEPLLTNGLHLQLSHFHSHWYLQRQGTPLLLIEPRRVFDRLTDRSILPTTSTQRELSAFEMVEGALRPKAQPRCSACHQVGHRMNSKICPLRYHDILPALKPLSPVLQPAIQPHIDPQLQFSTAESTTVTVTETETHITTTRTRVVTSTTPISTPSPVTSPQAAPQSTSAAVVEPEIYDGPVAIYRRYILDRERWYSQQPQRCRTDKLYRKAMKLRPKHPKLHHRWARTLGEMGAYMKASNGRKLRDWTEEEINAYIDFSDKEDKRVQKEAGHRPRYTGRRGIEDSIIVAGQDGVIQQAYYDNQIAT